MFKKRRNYRRKFVPKKSGRKSNVKGVSLAVKKYVNRTIHMNIENKQVQSQVSSTFGNVVNDAVLNVRPLTPYPGYIQISQGVTQNGRTGNEVKVRKALLKYVLYPFKYGESNNTLVPVEVQLFIGFVKNSSGLLPNTGDFNALYQYNNTTNPIFGDLFDLNQKFNTDYWVIKKYWRHKLGYSTIIASDAEPAAKPWASYANNDFKLNVVKTLDITKIYPKTLKFNDISDTLQGQGLFFFYQAVAADGSILAGSQTPAVINWQIDISYEDA